MTSGHTPPSSQPLGESELKQALGGIPVGTRVEEAFAQYLLAGISLGFARRAAPPLLQCAVEVGRGPLAAGLEHIAESLTQKAVLDTAATWDEAGEGANSLANALTLITQHLRSSQGIDSGAREAARKLVSEIRESVITKKSDEIKAVKYWRNKWAGHRSFDPQVDQWAADNPVDFNVIETALGQMKFAFNEFALLLLQVPELATLSIESHRLDDRTLRMGISLDGTSNWPLGFLMGIGEAQAGEFLDRVLPALANKQ